jgi:hypothetical protein
MSVPWVKIEGAEKIKAQLARLRRGEVRRVMLRVTKEQMEPLINQVKSLVPTVSGRLRASIGKLNRGGKSSSTYRIGTTGEFSFTSKRTKQKMYQAKGEKKQASLAAKGYKLDKTSPNLYAGGIEFGTKKSGLVARRAGGAMFLNAPMERAKPRILNNVAASFQRAIDKELSG